jgi:probable HAF family extracellular repeat protein
MKAITTASFAAIIFLCAAAGQAEAQLSYSVTDLGTLGGATSTANGVAGQGHNAAGMIVGSSTASDNSERAFLYTNGQMFDLNTLCDLSQSDFKILTVARTISDSCLIIGEGITTNGQKHAFLLTPLPVDGGQWSYVCCQWVWIQQGGGWWWETGCCCYKWHGLPRGKRPPFPPQPPHCWWWPLPCQLECGCTPPPPPPPPPPQCWCCIKGEVFQTTEAICRERGSQCYGSKEEALRNCKQCWCCIDGQVVQTNWADCRERGGQCYGSKEEALKNCTQCWCCIDGQVVQTNWADCREKGGQCYGSKEEALRNCTHLCWCCIDGKVVQTTETDCRERGGRCFGSREEALKNCSEGQTCWCCINGELIQTTAAICQQRGGKCFSSREEALKNCSEGQTCWCCINGEVIQTTAAICRQRGGQCYGSREEALRNCSRVRRPTPTPRGKRTRTKTESTGIQTEFQPPRRDNTHNTPAGTPKPHRGSEGTSKGKPTPTPRQG